MKLSIRMRLAIWYGIVLTLVLAGFGVTAFNAAWRDQLSRVDDELSAHLDLALKSGNEPEDNREPGPGRPSANDPFVAGIRTSIGENIGEISRRNRAVNSPYYVVFVDTDGTVFARSENAPSGIVPPAPLPDGRPAAGLIPNTIATTKWRTRERWREAYRTLPLGDSVLAGVSLDVERASMQRRAFLFALAGLFLLVCGISGGWWLTGKALKPIQHISRSASVIASGNLKERIPLEDSSTELGELTTVLNSTFARLEAAFARQTQFTSDASHELRTPISVILSKTQTVLMRDRTTTEYQDALRVCQRSANRMRELTEALLLLSRAEDGKSIAARDPLDLAKLAREAASTLSVLAEERNVQIDLRLDPAHSLGDAGQLSQVITNLLNNAIKFSHPGGVIHLRTAHRNQLAVLEVEDHGAGISAADLPHIFERFYRGDASRTGSGNYGLGLAIAKAIVLAHGGKIDVSSDEGKGARFTLSLPPTSEATLNSAIIAAHIC